MNLVLNQRQIKMFPWEQIAQSSTRIILTKLPTNFCVLCSIHTPKEMTNRERVFFFCIVQRTKNVIRIILPKDCPMYKVLNLRVGLHGGKYYAFLKKRNIFFSLTSQKSGFTTKMLRRGPEIAIFFFSGGKMLGFLRQLIQIK